MDYERLASELLRALRGKRSQEAFARRLGYRGNTVYSWESGRAFPTAARTLWIAQRSGVDVDAALARFQGGAARRAKSGHASTPRPQAVAALLEDLRGKSSVLSVAAATGRSRYRVARWLAGATEPRLPDLLRVIEATSLRLLDFLALLVDPAQLPSVATPWHQLEASREAAYQAPWSQAVLRVLELAEYRALRRHVPGYLAGKLGITRDEEKRCLALLVRSNQARMHEDKYVPAETRTIDTRRDREAARTLRAFWARVGAERLEAGADGVFAHNLFGVSNQDLSRIRELQGAYYRELRAIVANSQPAERVVLANLQLVTLV